MTDFSPDCRCVLDYLKNLADTAPDYAVNLRRSYARTYELAVECAEFGLEVERTQKRIADLDRELTRLETAGQDVLARLA